MLKQAEKENETNPKQGSKSDDAMALILQQAGKSAAEVAALDPRLLVCFTMGLKDSRLRQSVLMSRPQDFKEAVELAMDFEAEFGSAAPLRLNETGEINAISDLNRNQPWRPRGGAARGGRGRGQFTRTDRRDGSDRESPKCNYCQRPGHTEEYCRRKRARCYKCGQTGHLKRECRDRERNSEGHPNPTHEEQASAVPVFHLAPLDLN